MSPSQFGSQFISLMLKVKEGMRQWVGFVVGGVSAPQESSPSLCIVWLKVTSCCLWDVNSVYSGPYRPEVLAYAWVFTRLQRWQLFGEVLGKAAPSLFCGNDTSWLISQRMIDTATCFCPLGAP